MSYYKLNVKKETMQIATRNVFGVEIIGPELMLENC